MIDPKDNEWLEKFKRDLTCLSLPDFKVAMDYMNFHIESLHVARTLLEQEYEKRKRECDSRTK